MLTNRFLGMPIFFFFIWAMFQLTFTPGRLSPRLDRSRHRAVGRWVDACCSRPDWFKDLVLDGIIAGCRHVIVFLPNILILFFCIALFEDTGYMARAAFLMDKIMHLVGLARQILHSHAHGIRMQCAGHHGSAHPGKQKRSYSDHPHHPFHVLFRQTAGLHHSGRRLFRRPGRHCDFRHLPDRDRPVHRHRPPFPLNALFRGADAPFVMELPPYRMPMFKSLMIHMWDRSKLFFERMGGVDSDRLHRRMGYWPTFPATRTLDSPSHQ